MADKYKVPSDADKKAAIATEHLICVDIDSNENKYWVGYVLPNGDFFCEYGRVQADKGDCRHDYYELGSVSAATAHLHKKVAEKCSGRKGYTKQRIAGDVGAAPTRTASSTVDNRSVKAIATSQIQGDPEVKKLVSWLADVNVHQITSHSKIQFNVDTGSFTTPLGTLVTADAIVEARGLLNQLAPLVVKRSWNDTVFKRVLGDYLMLIPQDTGRTRGWHETFLAGKNALGEQNDLLDSLDASLTKAVQHPTTPNGKPDPVAKVFDVSLKVVGSTDFDRIKRLYDRTKGGHYDVQSYRPVAAWTVQISTVHDAYEGKGKPLGGIMELWHGTKASNLLSILKGGLVIPPSSSPHVCGRMFGDGLYFSDQSTKSIRYATGAWTSYGNVDRVFMFLANVAMGRYYVPSGPTSSKPPAGYHSYFAQSNRSGVANNEMIVPHTYQADLSYLIEFRNR
jgi:poly [ADP-ribose] polymerase